jgi:hypothetical protein
LSACYNLFVHLHDFFKKNAAKIWHGICNKIFNNPNHFNNNLKKRDIKMTNPKDQNTLTENQRTNRDETTLQQEVDLPTPEKKNDDITTGNRLTENETERQRGGDNRTQTTETGRTQNQNDQSGDKQRDQKNSNQGTGFDVNQKRQEKNDDTQRGDTTERERREREQNPEQAEFQDANWQRDKINQGFNEESKRNPSEDQMTENTKAGRTTEDGKGTTIKDVNNPQDQKGQQRERDNQNRNQNDKGPVKDNDQRRDQDKKKYSL